MSQKLSYANIMRSLILLGSLKILEAFANVDLEILELLSTTMSHERGSSNRGVSLHARMNMVESSINFGLFEQRCKRKYGYW